MLFISIRLALDACQYLISMKLVLNPSVTPSIIVKIGAARHLEEIPQRVNELLLEVGNTRLSTTGDWAFVNVAPFLWNRLPYSVRACKTV